MNVVHGVFDHIHLFGKTISALVLNNKEIVAGRIFIDVRPSKLLVSVCVAASPCCMELYSHGNPIHDQGRGSGHSGKPGYRTVGDLSN